MIQDFGYSIGEVELLVSQDDEVKSATEKVLDFCKEMSLDITPPIYGKVLQFIKVKRPNHFQVLQESGLIARKTFSS